MSIAPLTRRSFVRSAAALAGASTSLHALARPTRAGEPDRRIYKTLKFGMCNVKNATVAERFKLLKDIGFDGVELGAPGINVDEFNRAIQQTSLPVDGTVINSHWSVRHSDPNPDVRARAQKDLKDAIRQTHAVGGNTTLLVVGHGKDGSEEEVWNRSVENILPALPLAAYYGVYIAIENVWNHFCYDHGGANDQTADKFARYVDEFNSPWVGMQFDIGNHWKYGNPADWIRTLGNRIVKLDVKGFSRAADGFKNIGDGDLPWGQVRTALKEIDYTGWAAAEVGGGGRERLQEINDNLDKHLLGV